MALAEWARLLQLKIDLAPSNPDLDNYWRLDQTCLLESLRRQRIVTQEELRRYRAQEDLVGFWEWQLPRVVAQALSRALVASCFPLSRDRLIWFDVIVNLNLSDAEDVTCRCFQELMPAYRWVVRRRRLEFAVDWC
jgi:hypothetical protein